LTNGGVGNASLSRVIPSIRRKIRFEERGERKMMLNLMVLLYNFQAFKVGQNQIHNVYMPYSNCNALDYIR